MSKSMQSQHHLQIIDRQRQRRSQLIQVLLAVAVLAVLLMSRPAANQQFSAAAGELTQGVSHWNLTAFFTGS